jgi:hypothetical protein
VDREFQELVPADGASDLRLVKEELERQLREALVRDYDAGPRPLARPVDGTASESAHDADARP